MMFGRPEWFSATATVGSGLVTTGGLHVTSVDGVMIKGESKWTGIRAKTTLQIPMMGAVEDTYVFVDEVDLGTFQFPPLK